jgi:hypothetical protein
MEANTLEDQKSQLGTVTYLGARLGKRLASKILIPIVVAMVLGLVGWATHVTVQRAMKGMLTAKLETILEADVTGLRIWLETQKKVVDTVLLEPQVMSSIHELVNLANKSQSLQASRGMDVATTDIIVASSSLRLLRETLGPICRTHRFIDFLVIEPASGICIGAIFEAYVGKTLIPMHFEFIRRALSGETVVSRPFHAQLELPGEQGVLQTGSPIMIVAKPVSGQEGAPAAVLAFIIQPERDFTRILRVGRPGKSGETYAFDGQGLMISQSRFDEHLRKIGLLSKGSSARAILNVQIRDPGGNLLQGFRPAPRSKQPLTLMAASAISGKTDFNVNGYRDYRGVPVIGAWTWLDDYGFGVTTELDVDEAFRPLRLLRYAFGILFGLLILATLGVLFSARIISVLQLRMQRLGQYTIERKLGKGGMGAVYMARHAMLRRPTALKILDRQHSSEEAIARFEREVQLTSQLNNLNTIKIYDYGRTPDGTFYYAMEYLPGINLHSLIENTGPLPEGRVINILLQICASLNEAHNVGLIHRDIKPENLIICERGGDYDVVKVCDFGLVKHLNGGKKPGPKDYELPAGTPQYLSPEAIRAPSQIDGRADLYSVAGVGYYLLTGHDVFEGKTPIEICRKQVHETPQLPSERLGRSISEDLEKLILKCLEKDPDLRPKSAAALGEALKGCKDAGKWTQEIARNWWEESGYKLVQEELLRGEAIEVSESLIEVDLGKRVKL